MTVVYTVEWIGDEDCGGVNKGCIGVFADKQTAVNLAEQQVEDPMIKKDWSTGPFDYVPVEPDRFAPDNTVRAWRAEGERDQLLVRRWELQ